MRNRLTNLSSTFQDERECVTDLYRKAIVKKLTASTDIICTKQLVFHVFENNIFLVVAKEMSLTQINSEPRLTKQSLN